MPAFPLRLVDPISNVARGNPRTARRNTTSGQIVVVEPLNRMSAAF
jgi:hypothetical protein